MWSQGTKHSRCRKVDRLMKHWRQWLNQISQCHTIRMQCCPTWLKTFQTDMFWSPAHPACSLEGHPNYNYYFALDSQRSCTSILHSPLAPTARSGRWCRRCRLHLWCALLCTCRDIGPRDTFQYYSHCTLWVQPYRYCSCICHLGMLHRSIRPEAKYSVRTCRLKRIYIRTLKP